MTWAAIKEVLIVGSTFLGLALMVYGAVLIAQREFPIETVCP